eukprot:s3444_g12.t1
MDRVLLTLGNTQLQAVLDRNRGLFVLFQAEVTSAGGSWQAYDATPPALTTQTGGRDCARLRWSLAVGRLTVPSCAFPHLHQLPDPGRNAVCPSRRMCDAAGAEATELDLESATGAWRAQPAPPPLLSLWRASRAKPLRQLLPACDDP